MTGTFPDVTVSEEAGPSIRHLMKTFQHDHALFWKLLEELSPVQLDWKPAQDVDSIGMIVGHIFAWEKIILEADLLQNPHDLSQFSTQPMEHWGRSSAQVGQPVDAYLDDFAVCHRGIMEYMAGLRDEQLHTIIKVTRPWGNRETTIIERIQILLAHLLVHKGQIQVITMLDGFPKG